MRKIGLLGEVNAKRVMPLDKTGRRPRAVVLREPHGARAVFAEHMGEPDLFATDAVADPPGPCPICADRDLQDART
jgi:hypothetical protein